MASMFTDSSVTVVNALLVAGWDGLLVYQSLSVTLTDGVLNTTPVRCAGSLLSLGMGS